MDWQKWSDRLREELALGTHPVAVSFTGGEEPQAQPGQGKLSVCQALKKASEGESVRITADTCGCPGGLVSLGLGQMPAQGKERLVDFLVDKEKVYCSRIALHRGQQIVPAPAGVGGAIAFAPLSQAAVLPDVVIFIGKPGSLHHLLGFANYWEGLSMKAELAGPACRTGVAYPAVTGEVGLSLLDFGARRLAGFADDQILVAVPFHRMIGIMSALDHGAGGRQAKKPADVEREIDELGKVERV